MSHTADQEKVVLKVLSYKPHQFYEILEVSKTSSETEIKKSYRKLAIKLHPDKNPHPRAAEAFKIVNKAWSILSDPSKKNVFDSTGADPDSRFNPSMSSTSARTGGASPFSGGQFGQTAEFDDIFDFFFGQQQRGFGGGQQSFSFGNNGFTFQTFGSPGGGFGGFGAQPRARQQRPRQPSPQRDEPQDLFTILKQLAPIIFFVLISIIPSFFSDSTPEYSFSPSTKFNMKRQTPHLKMPFFVNESHIKKKNYNDKQMQSFDTKVENVFIQDKRSKCSKEQMVKNQLFDEAQGWFSVNQEKLRRAENYPMPNCQLLRDYNLI